MPLKTSPHSATSWVDPSHEEDGAPPQPGYAMPRVESPQSPDPLSDEVAAARDAKVRALQQAVARGTYQVSAEQLATKMLQDSLHEILP